MTQKIRLLSMIVMFFLALSGCDQETVVCEDNVFRFDDMNDIVFVLGEAEGTFSFLEGANIASGDYAILENTLTLQNDFLATLSPATYTFVIHSSTGTHDIEVVVADMNQAYRIINGGFETGDLSGWHAKTIFKGEDALQSFTDGGVRPNETMLSLSIPYDGDGNFVYGIDDATDDLSLWEEKMGILTSSIFTLSGSGWMAFRLGGGKNADLGYLSVRDALTGAELARFANTAFNEADFATHPELYFEANLVLYKADLSAYLGRSLYLELCDFGGRAFDFLTFDSFETYQAAEPSDGLLATDIRPLHEAAFIPNQVPNGDFSQGLEGWMVSTAPGWQNSAIQTDTWTVDAGVLKSNAGGDPSRGMIRSSLFRIDGSGIISLQLGAGAGERFDKDTYVSIRRSGTNDEIFRLANTHHDGIFMITYYVDLSAYLGQYCYFEIVDNGIGSYDTIFVDNIVTYHETAPVYDFGQAGINLNQ